jgi:carbonic anhydrase
MQIDNFIPDNFHYYYFRGEVIPPLAATGTWYKYW